MGQSFVVLVDYFDGRLIHVFCIQGIRYKGQNYCLMGFNFVLEGEPQNP